MRKGATTQICCAPLGSAIIISHAVCRVSTDRHLMWIGRRADAIQLADGTVVYPAALETVLRCVPLIRYARPVRA
jgi:hypothetical protein